MSDKIKEVKKPDTRPRLAKDIRVLPDGTKIELKYPIDSLMYKILSDTSKIKHNQTKLDSIRKSKGLKKEGNVQKIHTLVSQGSSVKDAARTAYPDMSDDELSNVVAKYKRKYKNKSKKDNALKITKVVLKQAGFYNNSNQ